MLSKNSLLFFVIFHNFKDVNSKSKSALYSNLPPCLYYLVSESPLSIVLSFNSYFLKPFLKGKILRSSERGVNSILTTILRF